MKIYKLLTIVILGLFVWPWAQADAKKKKASKVKPGVVKIISKTSFMKAIGELAVDERVPVASSTLLEKGRGEAYYSAQKAFDNDPETFWAEGAKGWGYNQWIAFHLPDGSTHLEIIPGAGKEQFQNFNRPKKLFLDVYLVKLKRMEDQYKPEVQWLGRNVFKSKDKPQIVRQKLSVKLPELVSAERTMYVGVFVIRNVYKGQFDDTSIASVKVSKVWGDL